MGKLASANSSYQIDSVEDIQRVHQELSLQAGSGTRKSVRKYHVLIGFLLEAAMASTLIQKPINFRQGNPSHEPDFVALCCSKSTWFEITEAGHPADQREHAEFVRSQHETILLGEHRGRFADGAVDLARPWIEDILAAVETCDNKLICRASPVDRHLLIYPNSNTSTLLDGEAEERKAFVALRRALALKHVTRVMTVNDCRVHVVGKHFVGFDVLGSVRVKRKQFVTDAARTLLERADRGESSVL
jgi:hypothetical protein